MSAHPTQVTRPGAEHPCSLALYSAEEPSGVFVQHVPAIPRLCATAERELQSYIDALSSSAVTDSDAHVRAYQSLRDAFTEALAPSSTSFDDLRAKSSLIKALAAVFPREDERVAVAAYALCEDLQHYTDRARET